MDARKSYTYAVADLHGRLDLFDAALEVIATHTRGATQKIVFLGDYIDRGPQSCELLMRLVAGPPDGSTWICLSGNHEAMMVAALAHKRNAPAWLQTGGDATVQSYERQGAGWRDLLIAHGAWAAALPLLHVDPHRVYVHAGVDPNVPLDQQKREVLLWVRHDPHEDVTLPGRHIVHGHVPVDGGPVVLPGRTDLDTRAWKTGRLVIGVYEDARPGAAVDYLEIRRPSSICQPRTILV